MDQVDISVSVSNTIPLESTPHELSEKKVKPPAIPPKTYREPIIEQNIMMCPSDDDTSVESINDDVDSVGSDSLYNMKLEAASEKMKLPERSFGQNAAQRGVIKPSFEESDREVIGDKSMKIVTDALSGSQNGYDAYQKLDFKTISPSSQYESLHSLKIKERDAQTSSMPDKCKQHPSTSHYEPLQLNNTNKPSIYQQVVLKKTFDNN